MTKLMSTSQAAYHKGEGIMCVTDASGLHLELATLYSELSRIIYPAMARSYSNLYLCSIIAGVNLTFHYHCHHCHSAYSGGGKPFRGGGYI